MFTANDVVGFVEIDGIALLMRGTPTPLLCELDRRVALAELVAALRRPDGFEYYSQSGCYRLKVEVRDDVSACAPELPPTIGQALDQAAIDSILSLGDTPESKATQARLRDHSALSELSQTLDSLIRGEQTDWAVSRRVPFEQIRPLLDGLATARERAARLIEVHGRLEEGPIVKPTREERLAVEKYLFELQRALAHEFESVVSDINERLTDAYERRCAGIRGGVEPRYREAIDHMMASFRKSGGIGRLFVKPILAIDADGYLRVVVRPLILAHFVRFGGYHAPLDIEAFSNEVTNLLRLRNDRPLWLRLVRPGTLSTWHRSCLRQIHRQAVAAVADAGLRRIVPRQQPAFDRDAGCAPDASLETLAAAS